MSQEPIWISESFVRRIQLDQLDRYGGRPGMRDESLLSASLARPRNLFIYGESPTIFDLAAYAYGLAKNHPFVDGNKRVAFVVMAVFLELNGYSLDAPEAEVVQVMLRLASGEETQESIAQWLESRSVQN
ncbi:type II toxin-antitoxin system death-on-curing family toxin [Leptolyngbya sp. FACHB-17]|uniref:type II toxin-antitoxin system death-on-curing family toxin n=1 Tax=unclassified Leptolyngbya TaxID=2650499 RepID=UPI00168139EE|nr:type II toxin-antitoxin system death-on-curing family toxin [Leptolyngbya sp. FACHB-17]MBD2079495.1 type II toxin-antitoxin system death-on-curing family toxin [Leptolyngbya sp. FACHB-17]